MRGGGEEGGAKGRKLGVWLKHIKRLGREGSEGREGG